MKKYLIVCVLFFAFSAFAQKSAQKKSEYAPIEITKTDGSKMNVLFKRMTMPGLSSFQEVFGGASNTNIKIEYKTSETGPVEKMNSKDIEKVKFLDQDYDEIGGFERLKIKEFDRNNVLQPTKKVIYMPQVYDGKISIYGEPVFICSTMSPNSKTVFGCRYAYSTFYLKNNQENFAVTPLDIKVFNMSRSFDNFVNAFKAAGKDCPEFNAYLEAFRKKMEDKEFQKKMRDDITDYRKEVKKQAKDLDLNSREKEDYLAQKMFFYEAQLYIGIVKEYEKNCPL